MTKWLILLFVAVPFTELFLLLKVAERMGAPWTFGLIVVTGVAGAALARWQGWRTAERLTRQLQAHEMPTETLTDAGMILVAAALLLTPGILTDLFGFSLLVPVCRRVYRHVLIRWLKRRFQFRTIDAHYTRCSDPEVRIVDAHVVRNGEDGHAR